MIYPTGLMMKTNCLVTRERIKNEIEITFL